MELVCQVQNYDWGKKGLASKVAELNKNANENVDIDENLPYAELWMGTHVNAPSVLKKTGDKLSSLIEKNPECLGDVVLKRFNGDLPFLFKVLSIDKALSIQAHPSKKHAEELHAMFPEVYKDPNHKPELAIALTPFEALCGFRLTSEIRNFVQGIPELKNIVGEHLELCDDTQFLKQSFHSVLTCDKNIIRVNIENLINRFKSADTNTRQQYLAELIERLHSQFPYDSGIFMVYFFNYLKLEPSQAIYLGANEPHAYLSGDCIECMACSDNVVRAGLTPKFIDVETLCAMLIYKGEPKDAKVFSPICEDQYTKVYRPPVEDFAVVQIKVPGTKDAFEPKLRNSASIVLVTSGNCVINGKKVVAGSVFFIPANESLKIEKLEDIILYQAIANV